MLVSQKESFSKIVDPNQTKPMITQNMVSDRIYMACPVITNLQQEIPTEWPNSSINILTKADNSKGQELSFSITTHCLIKLSVKFYENIPDGE